MKEQRIIGQIDKMVASGRITEEEAARRGQVSRDAPAASDPSWPLRFENPMPPEGEGEQIDGYFT